MFRNVLLLNSRNSHGTHISIELLIIILYIKSKDKNFLRECKMKTAKIARFFILPKICVANFYYRSIDMTLNKFSTALAVIIAAAILSCGMGKIGRNDRSVTVRGLSEREVAADLVVWPLSFTVGNNDLKTLQSDIIEKTDITVNFLNEYGLSDEDFTIQAPKITDNSVNPYIDKDRISYKYIGKVTVMVRSGKIEAVKNANKDSLKLAGDGITINQDYDGMMNFEFTGLNSIKPEMIAEATKNARLAAEQFARDSGSKVGKIKNATQGLFSIDNAAAGLEERKKVRVVTTVEYLLK